MSNNSDFLVIGSGIAGLMYALSVAEYGSVTVLCKSDVGEGSTRYAQGGIASVTSPLDSFAAHIEDTMSCGAGLCDEDIVKIVVTEGPDRIKQLIELGTKFDNLKGEYELGQEGGHSARRVLHARDATGAEVQRAIFASASGHRNISIFPFHTAIDFIQESSDKEVTGVYALNNQSGEIQSFSAKATMLATGGVGKVYLYTSNPDVATGDGIAMAYRAGAEIANMEFIQFHPTCLFHRDAKSFLITEAMRGEGARLVDIRGKQFMGRYDARGELSPRDIVARAIDREMKSSGDDFVYLDISHREKEFIIDRFPTIYDRLLEFGIDITKEPIPVVPAAHYCCGGVQCDSFGRTNLARLYVAGETACTGLHGANRLASNSLLEALVFAQRSAEHVLSSLMELTTPPAPNSWDHLDTKKSDEEVFVSHAWDEVRRVMWNLVGIVRSDARLNLALKRVTTVKEDIREYYWRYRVTSDLIELRNIVDVAELIIRSALSRHESRGLHYNIDYPETNDSLKANTVLTI